MTTEQTDRIEKKIILRAPRARVWRALTTAEEFGAWFGVKLTSAFASGTWLQGKITAPGYEHMTMDIGIERIEPESFFSYRWHPYAIDPKVDYSGEPTTLVEFRLDDVAEGTMLTVVESGFDQLPASRRSEAFRMNDGGWAAQLRNIERYVAGR
jgi:uncharacterized protein YndB with AHSA1/START domain